MSARASHSPPAHAGGGLRVAVAAAAVILFSFLPSAWGVGPHQRSTPKLESTQRTEYRITQNKEEKGRETVEKKTYDNNTVVLVIDASMTYGPGLTMHQHVELTVEEESFFPRSLHIVKKVAQPDSSFFNHAIDVEMFSNVAVVTSLLNQQGSSRRVVVPTGVAVADVGVLGYLYQMLFWYDRESGGEQRFQWLDPLSVSVSGGVINLEKEETIPVLGKKTKVSVFHFEREKLGEATVWVDKQGTIVRGEQNYFVYELVSRKNS